MMMGEGTTQFQGFGYLREFHYDDELTTLFGMSAKDMANLMVLFGSVAFFKS